MSSPDSARTRQKSDGTSSDLEVTPNSVRNRQNSFESRGRQNSLESVVVSESQQTSWDAINMQGGVLSDFWDDLYPILRGRTITLLGCLLFITIAIFSRLEILDRLIISSQPVKTVDWYLFFGFIACTNLVTCVLEMFFLKLVDAIANDSDHRHVHIGLYEGSMCTLATVLIVETFHDYFKVPKSMINWKAFVATAAIVAAANMIKLYIQRENYNRFVVNRFSSRIQDIHVQSVVLSRLACFVAVASGVPVEIPSPRAQEPPPSNRVPFSRDNDSEKFGAFSSSPRNSSDTAGDLIMPSNSRPCSIDSASPPTFNDDMAISVDRTSDVSPDGGGKQSSNLKAMKKQLLESVVAQNRKNVLGMQQLYAGIAKHAPVGTVPPRQQDYLKPPGQVFETMVGGGDDAEAGAEEGTGEVEDMMCEQLFWRRLEAAQRSELRLLTVNGLVVMKKSKQAQSFGGKLYLHLRYHNSVRLKLQSLKRSTTIGTTARPAVRRAADLTVKALLDILADFSDNGKVLSSPAETVSQPGPDGSLGPTPEANAIDDDEKAVELLDDASASDLQLRKAVLHLFGCGSGSDGADVMVTEKQLQEVCRQLYLNSKNMATSLADNAALRQSVNGVADVGFWLLMVVLSQITLDIDPFVLLTPLLSLILLLSFALSQILGNVFSAIGFIVFILPFDVGDRVAIGQGSDRYICIITSVGLLTTTALTLYNEKIQLANHVLYGTRIANLQQSKHACFELPVNFALFGSHAPSMEQIRSFWAKMVHYIEVEKKSDWYEQDIALHTLDATCNRIGYSFWVTNRASFYQSNIWGPRRRALFERMVEVQRELGITFIDIQKPVEIYTAGDRTSPANSVAGSAFSVGGGGGIPGMPPIPPSH